jgi:hypothetical protein
LLNKENIIDYLVFLQTQANEHSSKAESKEDDLRAINLEINKFLERLKESHCGDRRFMQDVESLKFSVNESKNTNRHWFLYSVIYGVLRLIPGMIVVHWKEQSDSKKRKHMLVEFEKKVDQLLANFGQYEIYNDF